VGNAVEERSQHANKRRAIRRLRERIALGVRAEVAMARYEPSETLRRYVSASGALSIRIRNVDYPFVVAELLDVLAACHARLGDASGFLGMNTAHLVAFFQADPHLWQQVNQLRELAGERRLR